jgi:hypothetical protein
MLLVYSFRHVARHDSDRARWPSNDPQLRPNTSLETGFPSPASQ